MMRQQQQDTLQLRMLQQQRGVQSPPGGAREGHEHERLQVNQEQRQQELHYRQNVEPSTAHPGDEAGIQRAKADRDRRQAQEEGEAQLRRFDSELRRRTETQRPEKARGEILSPEPPATLQ
jgi:RecB family endonuclease NucS